MSSRALLIRASLLFVLFVALGAVVSSRPPSVVDLSLAGFFFGQATPVALGLTRAGLFPTYVALCVLSLVFAAFYRAWMTRVLVAVAALIVAWQVSDLFKNLFHRPRMEHWLGTHETSYSYASGHAVLALTFWGIWAYYLRTSDLPARARIAFGSAIALLVLGIGWSRLALGAHYASDVIGGYALGGAIVCCAIVVDQRYFKRGAVTETQERQD